MGQAQGTTGRRGERPEVGASIRHRHQSTFDDECPVQMKIAKASGGHGGLESTPSLQYEETNEYPVVIKWSSGSAKNVFVSGSWNKWRTKIPLVRSCDDFTTILNLPEGRHEFKFCVDNDWRTDNGLPKTDNQLGTENNIMVVDKKDFEVFDALDRDLRDSLAAGGTDGLPDKAASGGTSFNQTEFTTVIPDRKAFETAGAPPALPPQLLQVILNQDVPSSCDPNVLPEPQHVMLNHLYALSIKDGVMVLSASHRYRKKYVTTLLYKPIK